MFGNLLRNIRSHADKYILIQFLLSNISYYPFLRLCTLPQNENLVGKRRLNLEPMTDFLPTTFWG